MLKRPLIAVGIVLLIIIGAVLVFNIPWGGTSENVVQDIRTSKELVDYADSNVKAQMVTAGEINSQREHRQISVTVGRDSVVATILRGYNGEVLRQRRYANTEASYRAFLSALKTAQFTNTQTTLNSNWLGACPTGMRYYFSLASSTERVVESWTTSCSRKEGTFSGDFSEVQRLFRNQVPDYSELTRGVDL